MLRLKSCGAIAAIIFIAGHCTKFDGHVDDIPPDISAAAAVLEKMSPHDRVALGKSTEMVNIGTIRILNQTVLPDSDFFAPLLNNLHFVTQKDVIFDELNLREGETLPLWRIYDAERYVRGLSPIKQAAVIRQKNNSTGKTDLVVVTEDKITAQINGSATGSGGYSNFGLLATESSLFGRLYSLTGSYTRENFRDFAGVSFGKQRINGSRWQFSSSATAGFSDSKYNFVSQGITVGHPFLRDGQKHAFTISTRYTNGVSYDYFGSGVKKGLDGGKEFDLIYRTRVEQVGAQYLYGIGKNHRIEFGPGIQHYIRRDYYIYPEDQYTQGETAERPVSEAAKTFYRPQQYASRSVSFAVNTRNGNFVPMKNFQRYLFVEDQFEGLRTGAGVSHANPSLGLPDHYTSTSFAASWQNNFFEQAARIELSVGRGATFWHNGTNYPTDDSWSAEWKAFYFTKLGTLALRESATMGYHLTAEKRSQIGSMFGRGFYYGSIFPDAGFLSSLEYRSPGLKLPYILLAGVAFFDYAGVGTTLGTLQWNPIVGLGLRSMLYEFDNNVFRFDVGFNLNDSKFNLLNSLQFGLSQSF